MNWMKLKSSIIAILTILLMNGSGLATTRQSTDTIVYQPAETILKMVLLHLPKHSPTSYNSYSSIIHHRFRIKTNLKPDTAGLMNDSTESSVNQNNNYLFSTETLTYQKQLKPDFNQSENLSNKTEGKDDGLFTKLDSCLSDISLLKPTINLFHKNYLSPFSESAFANYVYSLSDSITASGDSLYKISFHPRLGQRYDGFSGTVVINKKDLAIQQISAQATQSDPQEPLLVINQNFEQLNDIWLPSGSNVKVFFNKREAKNSPDDNEENLIAESTINIYQQQINPALSAGDFQTAAQPSSKTNPKPAISSGNYIYIPIDQKDSLLQLKADSTIIADIQNQQAKMIRLMAEGKIPVGYFDLDYNRIFGYNLFEGIKLGLGGETNRLLSRLFTVGGFISYGFKDQSVRHGEWINIYPTRRSDLRIYLGYKDINLEFGGPEFLENKSLLNPESYRNLLIKNMFSTKRYTTGLEFRPFNELNIYLFGDLSENRARQNTRFLTEHSFDPISLTRTGLQLRYSPGIKLKMEDGRLNEIKAPKSDYYLTIIQGLSIFDGDYRYTKLEVKGKFDLPFSRFGTSTILLRGGTMSQNGPVIELFNSHGSFAGTFSLAAPYSFATMQLNEFSAANYTALHFRHDFSTWLFPETFQKQPAFIFAQNIGFGRLNNQQLTQFNLPDYRKGFYESGFEVNNLLRMNFLSWGVGIYYRYGPYQFSSTSDNFAYKFGFFFKL